MVGLWLPLHREGVVCPPGGLAPLETARFSVALAPPLIKPGPPGLSSGQEGLLCYQWLCPLPPGDRAVGLLETSE